MNKLLKVGCGVTNHTHATVTQFIKMGIDPSRILVVDDNRTKYGSLTVPSSFEPDNSVMYVAFDQLADVLNRTPDVSDDYIFTKSDLGGLWDKCKQLDLLSASHNEHFAPIGMAFPSYQRFRHDEVFVRDVLGHGSKVANTLGDKFNTEKDFIVTPTCDFQISVMLQVTVVDGEIRWDAVTSLNKFKNYDKMFTVHSHTLADNSGFVPYDPKYQLVYRRDCPYIEFCDRMDKLATGLVEAFKITHGTFTTEVLLFDMIDFSRDNSIYYVETNFRPGDLSASVSPSNWWYLMKEFKKHNLV